MRRRRTNPRKAAVPVEKKKKEGPLRMLGYVRVSTNKQVDSGLSLELQADMIHKVSDLAGYALVGIIKDAGHSARSMDRPGLRAALKLLTEGKADGMIVQKLDRLTRSLKDLTYLIEEYFERYQFVSVQEHIDTTTATGRITLKMIIMLSEWEREIIQERTLAALQTKRDRGECSGTLPYGYGLGTDGVTVVEDEHEQAVIRYIQDRADAGIPQRQIAEELAGQGVRSRKDKPLSQSAICKLLIREERRADLERKAA